MPVTPLSFQEFVDTTADEQRWQIYNAFLAKGTATPALEFNNFVDTTDSEQRWLIYNSIANP